MTQQALTPITGRYRTYAHYTNTLWLKKKIKKIIRCGVLLNITGVSILPTGTISGLQKLIHQEVFLASESVLLARSHELQVCQYRTTSDRQPTQTRVIPDLR